LNISLDWFFEINIFIMEGLQERSLLFLSNIRGQYAST
jgi:hypothetical protein